MNEPTARPVNRPTARPVATGPQPQRMAAQREQDAEHEVSPAEQSEAVTGDHSEQEATQ